MSRKYYQVSRRRKGFSWFGWLIGFAILVGVVENIDKAVLILQRWVLVMLLIAIRTVRLA